jgi:hypothetical protein
MGKVESPLTMALPTVRGQLMNFSSASVAGLMTGKRVSKAMRVHQNLYIHYIIQNISRRPKWESQQRIIANVWKGRIIES